MALALGITHREAASLRPAELALFQRHFRRVPTMQALFVRYACAALTTGKRGLHPHEFAPEMYAPPKEPAHGRTGASSGVPGYFARAWDRLRGREG